jgi:alkaline phosphatase
LKDQKNSPTGDGTDATDQPGLKEMTLKALDILQARSKGEGWFMMFVPETSSLSHFADELWGRSEAASIDKMMHVLDYERALGELLELDDTVRATIARKPLSL